ncbi:MAG: hypothetical protein B6D61_08370 [Bacteroidetes bacterium 4484_249]|nr:MAG: hypothetical protein B6D61_08370 [Bacteroidetes bacterium 4484_249]
MFARDIISELTAWSEKKHRKPLILRGARQVGKTTIVEMFARQFEQYLYINLENDNNKELFNKNKGFDDLVQLIFLKYEKFRKGKKTLIFFDEIQQEPKAIAQLRYFYEEAPDLYVIAAGSLLDVVLKNKISFPVGRVEYRVLRPVSFHEFLKALGKTLALEQFEKIPLASFAHLRLLELFHIYALIGGMPEIILNYVENKDYTQLVPIYETLLTSYIDDVEKYAHDQPIRHILRYIIPKIFIEGGKRIKFQGFGDSNYKSREMGEALRTLERAWLLHLVYPTVDTRLPYIPDYKKVPRLQVLDTGLINHFAGLKIGLLSANNLNEVYEGKIAEHIVGQELLAKQYNVFNKINFWVNEKKGSMAEVDFLYLFQDKLIPIEVKSGASGKLKSLHKFMELAPHSYAVRCYAGELRVDKINNKQGKAFFLLNLPYYLISQIDKYLEWFTNSYLTPGYNIYKTNIEDRFVSESEGEYNRPKSKYEGIKDIVEGISPIDEGENILDRRTKTSIRKAINDIENIRSDTKSNLEKLLFAIYRVEGKKVKDYSLITGIPVKSIERYVKILREENIIIFRGEKKAKNAGYFFTKSFEKN